MSDNGGKPDRHRVAIGIEREGTLVQVFMRQGGRTMDLEMGHRYAAAFAATLAAAITGEEDFATDFEVRATLHVKENEKP